MKKLNGILCCIIFILAFFCSKSFATTIPYSVLDTQANEVWTTGYSTYFYDANRYILPSGIYEWTHHSVNEDYNSFRIESNSGTIGEKVLVGFTFDLTTVFNNSINESIKDDFEFGFFENGFDFNFSLYEEGTSYFTQTVNEIINYSDPWSSSTTATSFTLYSELDTHTDYSTAFSLDEFFNAENPIYSGSLNDLEFADEFGLWNELYIRGSTDLTDISVVTPIPEPATIILFGTGIVGLAASRIRRKKKL